MMLRMQISICMHIVHTAFVFNTEESIKQTQQTIVWIVLQFYYLFYFAVLTNKTLWCCSKHYW